VSAGLNELVDAIVARTRTRDAKVVGVTGGIAAGKSYLAARLSDALGWPTVSTDGFIRADAGARKGYADSYDAPALQAFIDAVRNEGRATAPRYSHLRYTVVGHDEINSDTVVVDGLHLGHPSLGIRDRIDVLVHLDAPTDTLSGWYLTRFEQLRAEAANEPTAMLYPYRDVDADTMNGTAMQVWRDLNALVIEEEVRPNEGAADIVVRLGDGHAVVAVESS
jgi:type I pantothenate kinase